MRQEYGQEIEMTTTVNFDPELPEIFAFGDIDGEEEGPGEDKEGEGDGEKPNLYKW